MTSKIRILDEHTINQIAAGEVIENPASVVKELVENAEDAAATEITVEIKGGGRQLIRVSDNGTGMNRDDALLCFERHATSKLKEINDLHQVGTMGFRGEAIPSIASISKTTLVTCGEDQQEGTLVVVDGGKILRCHPAPRSRGTTFEVKSLFFNVPVRKKFQRSPTYDKNEVLKVLAHQALAHPHIKFQLICDEKIILSTTFSQNEVFLDKLGTRISDVFGAEFFSSLSKIDRTCREFDIVGYLGFPSFTRQNRTGQYLFINKRSVSSPLIYHAVKEGYSTSLPPNRFPVFVLHLTMDGKEIDINVHPQKREVRFRREIHLKEMVRSAIEEGLQISKIPSPSRPFSFPQVAKIPFPSVHFEYRSKLSPRLVAEEKWQFISNERDDTPCGEENALRKEGNESGEKEVAPYLFPSVETSSTTSLPTARVIATLPQYLVLVSDQGTLTLLDIWAAHSKILFEQMTMGEPTKSKRVQNLLIPLTFDLTSIDATLLKENCHILNKIGMHIHEFGQDTFIINAVPPIFDKVDIKGVIFQLLDELRQSESKKLAEMEIIKQIAHTAARSALSPHKRLSIHEGQSLYDHLMGCQSPHRCPIGRPTVVAITHEDILKLFQKSSLGYSP